MWRTEEVEDNNNGYNMNQPSDDMGQQPENNYNMAEQSSEGNQGMAQQSFNDQNAGQQVGYAQNMQHQDYQNEGAYQTQSNYVQNNEEPKKPGKKGKLGIVFSVIGVAAIACIAVAVLFLTGKKSPAKTVVEAFVNTTDAIGDKSEYASFLSDYLTSDKLGISVTGGMKDYGVDISCNFATDGKNASLTADATMSGFKLDAKLYGSENELVVTSNSLVDGKLYGINLNEITENLPNSIFASDSDSDYALDAEEEQQIMDYINQSKKMEGFMADIKSDEISKTVKAAIIKAFEDNLKFNKTKKDVEVDGSSVSATVIECSFDQTTIANIVKSVCDQVKDEEQIEALFTTLSQLDESITSEDTFASIMEAVEDPEVSYKGTLSVALNSKDQMMTADITLNGENGAVQFEFIFGKDPEKSNHVSGKIIDESSTMSYEYTVSEDTNEKYHAEYKISTVLDAIDYTNEIVAAVDYNRVSGEADVTLSQDDNIICGFKGNVSLSKDQLTIKPQEFTYSEGTISLSDYDITVVLDKAAKVERYTGDYADILDMSSEDFDALIQELGTSLSGLFTMLLGY